MLKSEYTINRREYHRKKKTILKKKLVHTLKAYAITNIELNEELNTLTCNMTVKKDGATRKFPKPITVVYQTVAIPDDDINCELKLFISIG